MLMDDEALLQALHQITVVDNLRCLGCGYENSCSIKGCAIIRQAAERLQALTELGPNDPLTLEELREMDREPVWTIQDDGNSCWALIRSNSKFCISTHGSVFLQWEDYGKRWIAYRRRPEKGKT